MIDGEVGVELGLVNESPAGAPIFADPEDRVMLIEVSLHIDHGRAISTPRRALMVVHNNILGEAPFISPVLGHHIFNGLKVASTVAGS